MDNAESGFDFAMPKQFPDESDIGAVFQKMSEKSAKRSILFQLFSLWDFVLFCVWLFLFDAMSGGILWEEEWLKWNGNNASYVNCAF